MNRLKSTIILICLSSLILILFTGFSLIDSMLDLISFIILGGLIVLSLIFTIFDIEDDEKYPPFTAKIFLYFSSFFSFLLVIVVIPNIISQILEIILLIIIGILTLVGAIIYRVYTKNNLSYWVKKKEYYRKKEGLT